MEGGTLARVYEAGCDSHDADLVYVNLGDSSDQPSTLGDVQRLLGSLPLVVADVGISEDEDQARARDERGNHVTAALACLASVVLLDHGLWQIDLDNDLMFVALYLLAGFLLAACRPLGVLRRPSERATNFGRCRPARPDGGEERSPVGGAHARQRSTGATVKRGSRAGDEPLHLRPSHVHTSSLGPTSRR